MTPGVCFIHRSLPARYCQRCVDDLLAGERAPLLDEVERLRMEGASLRSELTQVRERLADEEQAGVDLVAESVEWRRRADLLGPMLREVCEFGYRKPADWMYDLAERETVAAMFRRARTALAESMTPMRASAGTEAPVSEPTPSVDEVEQGAALRAEVETLREALRDAAAFCAPLRIDKHGPEDPDECERGLCGLVKKWRALSADPEAKPTPSKNPAVAEDR